MNLLRDSRVIGRLCNEIYFIFLCQATPAGNFCASSFAHVIDRLRFFALFLQDAHSEIHPSLIFNLFMKMHIN